MTHYIDAMRAAGHLHERRNPVDGRSYLVRLTPAGLAAQRRANRGFEEGYRRFVVHLVDPAAAAEMLDAIARAAERELLADARPAAS
jgi:DNA-binding MarR family transcriptional regulator